MSANLGSGARTTTGGTYENPRLGIQDYTAFSRGVASSFKLPEKEEAEVQQLEGGIDYFGADQDAILGGLEFKENLSLVKNFANGPLSQMQAQYEKCSKANNQRCLQAIENDLNIYQTGQNNFRNLIQNYADGEVYDPETSNGRFLIDVNGNQIKKPDGSFLEIKDLTKVNNDNPQDMNIGIALNKNGDKKAVYQFKMDGQTYTTNISDLTDNYLKSKFDVRSNIGVNIQTAMGKNGSTQGWKDNPVMFSSQSTETTEEGVKVTELKGFEKVVSDTGYFSDADSLANTFAVELYKTSSSPGNNSAFHALAKRLYNNKFTSIVEGYTRPTTKNETDFINELKALPNDVKLAMLQDEGREEWKIRNASKGHKRGEDGRAVRLDKDYLVKTTKTIQPVDEGVGDFNFTVDSIVNLIGEGRMTGVEEAPGTFKTREIAVPNVVRYLNTNAPKGINFFNLRDDSAIKNIMGIPADQTIKPKQRQQYEQIIKQLSPGQDNLRLVGYMDTSGNPQVTTFDGTVGSLLNVVASFQPKINNAKLREAINKKFGADIELFNEPDRAKIDPNTVSASANPNILINR